MKTIRALTIVLFINSISLNLFSQNTFSYRTFRLNEVVTFNDVVNLIEDKEKIITEPSVYITGENIKFHDSFNTITELTFIENTQTLKCIFIDDIADFEYVNSLRQSVIQQLGDPTWGFEKKLFHNVQKNHIMSDYYTYDIRYEFKTVEYKISIQILNNGFRIINKVTNEQYDVLIGDTFFLLKKSYELYGKNVYITKPIYCFYACIHKIDEYNSRTPDYTSSHDNYDYGWQKQTCEMINKW